MTPIKVNDRVIYTRFEGDKPTIQTVAYVGLKGYIRINHLAHVTFRKHGESYKAIGNTDYGTVYPLSPITYVYLMQQFHKEKSYEYQSSNHC